MSRRSGLSLLETILATAMVAGVALLLLNLHPILALSVVQAEQHLAADEIAQSVLDRTRSGRFSDLEPGAHLLDPVVVGSVAYRPRLEVFQPAGTRSDLLRGLRVTVRWTGPRGPRETTHEIWIHHLDN